MNISARILRIALLPALAVLAILATSCLKSSESSYTMYSFVSVLSPSAVKADDGVKLNVIADNSDGKWASEDRLYIMYTIKGDAATADGYNITLEEYAPSQIKHALFKSIADSTAYGNDPVKFSGGAISGTEKNKYFNVLACYTARKGTTTPHTVDLVVDDSEQESGILSLSLVHNGAGEVYGNDTIPSSDFVLVYKYLSFPYEQVTGGKDISTMKIKYTYYNTDSSGALSTTTSEQTITVNIK